MEGGMEKVVLEYLALTLSRTEIGFTTRSIYFIVIFSTIA